MKNILFMALVFAFSLNVNAQVTTPQPSPFGKLEQKVGLTDVTVEYSRPSVRGRKIFGALEPFGGMWRTGANKNTVITFSDDVTIEGHEVKAGSYAIFTKLNSATQWDVIFYNDTNNWGVPQKWDESKVAATARVDVMEIPFNVETLAIDINSITNNGATIEIIWEQSYAAIPFTVPTADKVAKSIDAVMAGPNANDYYAAAVYYSQEGKNLEQAKEWMEKAISMVKEPKFWQLRQLSLIYSQMGDKKLAIESAKKSLAAAEKDKNDHYVKLNKDSLKEWGAM